jgi:hypothetical protein
MKPPIIEASEPNDLLIFESKEKAERFIEAVDLLKGECILYDSEGRLLDAKPHPNGSIIIIEPIYSDPTHKEDLKKALINFFRAIGEDEQWLSAATLPELIEKGLKHKVE